MKVNKLDNEIISIELEVPFTQLKKKDSVYCESQELDEKLFLDIRKNGLIKRLQVKIENGFFVIVNGNRRFDALSQLRDEGIMNDLIPVIIEVNNKENHNSNQSNYLEI